MDNQYLDLFIEESKEHILSLNQNILYLESNPEDMGIINEVFRSAHTIKGMAGSMGFDCMADLTHKMENLLDDVRNHKISITSHLLDLLFGCIDKLDELLNDIMKTGKEERNIQDLVEQIARFSSSSQETHGPVFEEQTGSISFDQYQLNIIKEGEKQGLFPYQITVTLQETCLLKAARAYIVFKTVEKFGEIVYSKPSVQEIENESFNFIFSLVVLCQCEKETIQKSIRNISEIKEVKVTIIDVERLQKPQTTSTAADLQKSSVSKEIDIPSAKELNQSGNKVTGKSVRVDVDRLDNLMNLVSELIIVKNQIKGTDIISKGPNATQSVEYLERVTSDLHNEIMKIRMVPIETVFNRFPRVVRDLAKSTEKQVELKIFGAETEVDRAILDEIGEPLIHLIRNSIDHGLESNRERDSLGKPSNGSLDLSAYYDGNNVVVEVKDDGRGMNIEKIAKKAVEKGIVSQEEIQSMQQTDIIQFVFHPGFSTAENISSISGRGVGLDVVQTKIESLGGTVEIVTKEKVGTRFIIRLPLSLSIIQGLLVKAAAEPYVIPLGFVKEIIDISINDIKTLRNQEVFSYRGELIPIIRLYEILDAVHNDKTESELNTVVIVKKGEKLYGYLVDDLVGQQEVVIKPLGLYLKDIKIISGATVLGDGQAALILDINHIA